MNNRNFLLQVLSLSAIPRIVTSVLTAICFPLMVRSLGAANYGIVIYIGAIISIMESFVDFGVSTAAGKAIAQVRDRSAIFLNKTVVKWAKLQGAVGLIGFAPLLLTTYFLSKNSKIGFDLKLMILLVCAAWMSITLNFVRMTLTSLLVFKQLAVLDTFESLFRSLSWLTISFLMPTPMGLAIATIATAFCASSVGAGLVFLNVQKRKRNIKVGNLQEEETGENNLLSIKVMIKDSLQFLWLRLVTRIFQSIPVILFGKIVGSELVGIFGAFTKIGEILNFPFNIIGNALAVRVHGITEKGLNATKKLWDLAIKLVSLSLLLVFSIYIGADVLARILLPNNINVGGSIQILSFTILFGVCSYMITPMSDYVGALKSRNIFMSFSIGVQAGLIWLGGHFFKMEGALIAYLLVLLGMNTGYISIALRIFFGTSRYHISREVIYFIISVIVCFLLSYYGVYIRLLKPRFEITTIGVAIAIMIFFFLVFCAVFLDRKTRKYYFTRSFFTIDA
ncbi:MAG TPA: oligosaccharide flippase family protein [Niabella sp.]